MLFYATYGRIVGFNMYFSLQVLLLFHSLSSVHLKNVNSIVNGTIDVIEHQIHEFLCVLTGLSTEIRWYINSTEVQETRNITMPNGTLHSFYEYVGSRTDLGKIIHCEATYGNRTLQTSNVILNIIHGPQNSTAISPFMTTVSQTVGSQLNPIRCSADCYPPCQYQWLKDSKIVIQDQTLSIDAIKISDNGNYTCRAWNEAGEEFINITLTVNCNLESYSPSSPRLSFSEGIGTGAGGVLLVVIVILIIFIVNKKRKKKQLHKSTGYDETHNTNRQSNVYDEIKEFSKDTNQDHQEVGSQQNS